MAFGLTKSLLALTALFLIFSPNGNALQCYSCDGEDCIDFDEEHATEITCEPITSTSTTQEVTSPGDTTSTTQEVTSPGDTTSTTQEVTSPEDTTSTTQETTTLTDTTTTTQETTTLTDTTTTTQETTTLTDTTTTTQETTTLTDTTTTTQETTTLTETTSTTEEPTPTTEPTSTTQETTTLTDTPTTIETTTLEDITTTEEPTTLNDSTTTEDTLISSGDGEIVFANDKQYSVINSKFWRRQLKSAKEGEEFRCYKIAYTDTEVQKVKRGCVQLPEEYERDELCRTMLVDGQEFNSCHLCDGELCNPAARAVLSALALVLPVVLALVR